MKFGELLEDDTSNTNVTQKPQTGDIVIVSFKGGQYVGIIGEITKSIAKIYDYSSRRVLGSIIVKYLNISSTKSKHPRKELARRLGFQSNDSDLANKYTYQDVSRVKYKDKKV